LSAKAESLQNKKISWHGPSKCIVAMAITKEAFNSALATMQRYRPLAIASMDVGRRLFTIIIDGHRAGGCAFQFLGDKAAAGWDNHIVAGVLLCKSTYMRSSGPGHGDTILRT
jgi:hypothetical protein